MAKRVKPVVGRKTFVSEIISRMAPKLGAEVIIEPEYGFVGMIIFKNGKKVLFRDRNFNINPLGSSEIARDKGYADFFLKYHGYRTIEGQTFFSARLNHRLEVKRTMSDGYTYAKSIGYPVILKPNNLSQGALVVKVHNKKEFYSAAKRIFERSPVMLVQRFYPGRDYRIVVLDQEVISAYERIPMFVVGDGKSTVSALVNQKQKLFRDEGRDTEIDLEDFRIGQKLKRQGLDLGSVIASGEKVFLLDNANLSTGGDAVDLTDELHSDYRVLAIDITRDMGLRMCGVDIICPDLCRPKTDYVVIEINSAPGLDNYAMIGSKQKKNVDGLYLKVLKALESPN